ncbi:MAG: O-antigen ligase family protein [Candidatus Geothermincolia bacterium]
MGSDRNPSLAGWWLTAALLLLPPLIQGGTPRLPSFVVELGILSLVVFWAVTWARAPRRELRLNALDALLGFLLFWSLFSTLFAPYYHPAEAASLAIACYVALYAYLSFNPSFAGLSVALGAVRAQAVFQSLLVLGEAIGFGRDRPAGLFFNPNFLAGFLAATLLLVVGGQIFPQPGSGRRPLRAALAAAEATLLLAALLTTSSRGGALALAVGLLLLFALRSWKVAAAAFSAAVVALLAIPNPLLQRLQTLSQTDNFAFTRLAIWKSAWSMMLDHPWLGIGLGQYEYVSTRYAFPIETHWAKYSHVAENAHSEYLQAGAELGVPGFLVALGVVALLGWAAFARLRALPRASWGPVATLLAAGLSIAVQAAVDFPLHTPSSTLLLVLIAAGLRLHGVTGPEHTVSFRVRPFYAVSAGLVALVLVLTAARPLAGFWFYLGGIGAPRNLFREKWALEEAPRRELSLEESTRLIGLAARVDFSNASYRRALGSLHFRSFLRGEGGLATLKQALYQLNYAAELNPNQFQYAVNLGQAMTSLARREPPGRERLEAALGHYRHAAELAPFQLGVLTEIGLLNDELGNTPAAEAAFRRAVALEEYYLRGWFNLGTFYARHGRLTEAREAFGRGAELAEKAPTLVPTSQGEVDLLAIKPAVFYNELEKINARERAGGAL